MKLANLKISNAIEKSSRTKTGRSKTFNLKLLRNYFNVDDDQFIEEETNKQSININQTININKPIQTLNINQTSKVKTTKKPQHKLDQSLGDD